MIADEQLKLERLQVAEQNAQAASEVGEPYWTVTWATKQISRSQAMLRDIQQNQNNGEDPGQTRTVQELNQIITSTEQALSRSEKW